MVAAGTFRMGSPADEDGRALNEEAKAITFASPFAAGRYPVTFKEWDACVADGGCGGHVPSDEGWGRGRQPVVNVSWDDANAYVAWLSRKTGKGYRLLTESEREYITRAGTATPYWWGGEIDTTRANIDYPVSATDAAKDAPVRHAAVAVDSFKANAWGFYSVHGNVWEWTQDCWNDDNTAHPSDGRALLEGDCGRRAARGGSWNDFAPEARAAARFGFDVASRNGLQGFRVGRD